MSTEKQQSASDDTAPATSTDLRAVLMADLKEQFNVELTGKSAISDEQRNAVIKLIGENAPTPTEIVKALTSKPAESNSTING